MALDILFVGYLKTPEAALELPVAIALVVSGLVANGDKKTTESWETALEWVDFVLPYRTKFASMLMMSKDVYEGKNLLEDDPVISTFVNHYKYYKSITDNSINTNNQQPIIPASSPSNTFDLIDKNSGRKIGRFTRSEIEKLGKGGVISKDGSSHSIMEIGGEKKLITVTPKQH